MTKVSYKMQIEYPEEHRNIYEAGTFWELGSLVEALLPLAGKDITLRIRRIESEVDE